MSERLPYMPMYWSEYVNHPPLRLCSPLGRALWPDILKICWEATPRGHFLLDGKQPTMPDFAKLTALPLDAVAAGMLELEAKGVFSRTSEGVIFCRRMVREEEARKAKAEKARGENEATPTERDLMDRAVRTALEADAKLEKTREANRERKRRQRDRDRAARTLDQARAFNAMAAAAAASDARADGRGVTLQSVTGHVPEGVTVTGQAPFVTVDKRDQSVTQSDAFQEVRADVQEAAESKLDSNLSLEPDRKRTARSLATLTGGSLAEGKEGEGTPRALQERIASRLARTPIQAPSETDEAFAARCAAASRADAA